MTPFEIADALRACLDGAFTGDTGKPAEICHRPGDIVPFNLGTAQDECCTGLGWVRIVSVDPVIDPLTATNPDFNPCAVYGSRTTLELGVARCNPSGTQQAGPTCEQWTELAARMDLDRGAMRRAVCCLAANAGEPEGVTRVLPGTWLPLDSSGGCAGGTLTVVVHTDCDECGS